MTQSRIVDTVDEKVSRSWTTNPHFHVCQYYYYDQHAFLTPTISTVHKGLRLKCGQFYHACTYSNLGLLLFLSSLLFDQLLATAAAIYNNKCISYVHVHRL